MTEKSIQQNQEIKCIDHTGHDKIEEAEFVLYNVLSI